MGKNVVHPKYTPPPPIWAVLKAHIAAPLNNNSIPGLSLPLCSPSSLFHLGLRVSFSPPLLSCCSCPISSLTRVLSQEAAIRSLSKRSLSPTFLSLSKIHTYVCLFLPPFRLPLCAPDYFSSLTVTLPSSPLSGRPCGYACFQPFLPLLLTLWPLSPLAP